MPGDSLIVILPIMAIVLAGLSIAGLWYWWSSTKEEGAEEQPPTGEMSHTDTASPPPVEEETVGGLVSRLMDTIRPVAAGLTARQSVVAPPPTSYPATAYRVGDEGMVEVMRVLRDLADGSLVIEIDGRKYRDLAEITDGQVGRRFLGNAQALARFARLGEIQVPDSWMAPRPAPTAFPDQPSAPATSDSAGWQSATLPPPPGPLPSVMRSRPSAEAEDMGSTRRGGLFGVGAKPEKKEEPAAPLSIADQIEELLQYRLTLTPALSQRSIHIRPSPDGGVRIEVDGVFYEGVSNVVDANIREFIQATIREWEARQ